MTVNETWQSQLQALGSFIRAQRRLSNLSLREMAELTKVSNPYLSQIERGLHEPSVRVLRSIAGALNLSAETLLAQAGLLDPTGEAGDATVGASVTEAAIRVDPHLSDAQKEALLSVYRSFLGPAGPGGKTEPAGPGGKTEPAGPGAQAGPGPDAEG